MFEGVGLLFGLGALTFGGILIGAPFMIWAGISADAKPRKKKTAAFGTFLAGVFFGPLWFAFVWFASGLSALARMPHFLFFYPIPMVSLGFLLVALYLAVCSKSVPVFLGSILMFVVVTLEFGIIGDPNAPLHGILRLARSVGV